MNIGKINATDTLGRINDLCDEIERQFRVRVTLTIERDMDGSWVASFTSNAREGDHNHGIFARAFDIYPTEAAETARSRFVRALRQHRAMDRCDEGGGT